ncbi:MAG: hypothetical protein KatS3mg118_0569 [Paracoccaceae bacterium]|nr:MAG: hypothetical protein KatS3mg118_0569 [Paracoccaceae bacterium]
MLTRSPLRRLRAALAAAGLAPALAMSPASAADGLLTTTVTVFTDDEAITGSDRFPDVDALIDSLRRSGYERINPAYTPKSVARVDVNFRGVDAVVSYPTAGSRVEFIIPSIDFVEVFDAPDATRAQNEDALERFLRRNEDALATRLLREAVRITPFDPVAGSPNSLMSKMVEADFIMGTTVGPEPSQVASASDGYDRSRASFGINARFGRFSAAGRDAEVYDLPLNYAMPLDDPRYAVIVDAPFTFVRLEGTDSYSGSLGLGVRLPLYDNWTLTPAIRGGLVGSFDLGTVAGLGAVSLTSNYRFTAGELNFVIGNSVAYIQTFPISYDGSRFDYDLHNVVLRNGIAVSGPLDFKLFGQGTTWEASVVNTRYFGSDLYAENVTDIAISFGTVNSVNGFTWDSVRLGLTYTFASGSDYQGLRVNFGYRF